MTTEIVALKRVSAYRSTDGKLHDTRLDATRHQARLDLASLLDMAGVHASDDVVDDMVGRAPEYMAALKAATKGDA